MTYTVKEIFKTLQGEGFHAGKAAVFLRFAGCNLWSGREEDRAGAICKFCDTDFLGGTKFAAADALADHAAAEWGEHNKRERFLVLTGGEPGLQYDVALKTALKKRGFAIAIETNGTQLIQGTRTGGVGVDWLCVSPKAGTRIEQHTADELKLAFPQRGLMPEEALRLVSAEHHWLQPIDGPKLAENTAAAVAYCLAHPAWRLSVQTHKFAGFR